MKAVEKNVRWTKKLLNKKFENMNFEALTVLSKTINNCTFINIEFKHSSLGSKTTYKNCKFIKCTYTGMYASLGNPSNFINCIFQDCTFQGKMMFMGSIFRNSKFSGKMKNNILTNEKRCLKKLYKFEHCDLTAIEFENVSLNGNRFFKSCQLPKSSIRTFENDNDELIDFALKQIEGLDAEIKKSIAVIFDKKLRSGLNPFIIDIPFLKNFLDEAGKLEFEKIVNKFEIK